MSRSLHLPLIALLWLANVTTLWGAIVTVHIDLSGVSDQGNQLRVFGTVDVDPTLPVFTSVDAFNLQVQRNLEVPLALNDTFISPSRDGGATLEWNLSGNELYINRVGIGAFGWRRVDPDPRGGTQVLGGFVFTGANESEGHFIGRSRGLWPLPPEFTFLNQPSGPDGPTGFLVGTVVPEPSAALLVAGAGLLLTMHRRRTICFA